MERESSVTREQWLEYRKSGSCYVTAVELEFHHLVMDPNAPHDFTKLSPTPSHTCELPIDARSNILLCLLDGAPAHARWCADESVFKRIGDDKIIEITEVSAWAPIPFPIVGS